MSAAPIDVAAPAPSAGPQTSSPGPQAAAPHHGHVDLDEIKGRPCSVAAALLVVGDRWSLLAVREVLFGNHRFSEIVRNTGAPRDRLAARLKVLVEAGVLEKRQYQDSPPRSSYHLTGAGRALGAVLQALRQWGDEYVVDAPTLTLHHHGHEITTAWYCATCGEPVGRDVEREVTTPGWDLAGPTGEGARD
ncbi:helix-turn-helix transcriptional regulator [Jatrophihabitans telluris]|uniref:Helix-turn-helix transcriptional regulator n=1 Tax=Jatrophihabitans telluris TaxID=2038343 RepID=A0ABY4QXP3_9ACTN|nr:helix-turn-helix domain-containing protein [Jatrophihabitans telluris]UQX88280.1 helix-turn-helix transcriptional regulator [Jatrophihabitans telluris]